MVLTDEQVVEKVKKDKECFGILVERYSDKLLRYSEYLLRGDEEAQDVVQRGLIKAYVNLNSFDTNKKFSSWVYRIIHNETMSAMRKRGRLVSLNENMDWQNSEDLEESLIKKEINSKVHNCLGEMPNKYRVVLSLYYLEEKSYEEISDILRLPMGTVATQISRAKKIMKSICNKK